LFNILRASVSNYYDGVTIWYDVIWDVETNLKFNEYSRPELNVRWNISGSPNIDNITDSNKYFFMNFFYNQKGNSIQYHTTHSSGIWSFSNYWGPQGNNYLRITCRCITNVFYLNINIS